MTPDRIPVVSTQTAQAALEQAFIDAYLLRLGYSHERLASVPHADALQILRAASEFASLCLTEIEARAHLITDIHGIAKGE